MEIIIAQEPWQKFWAYTDLVTGEVGAFGYVTLDGEQLYVDDIFIVPQEASSSEVDFVTEGLPYALDRAIRDDRVNDLRFCIHSHGNIGVMFSSIDHEMVAKMASTGTPWFASAVVNKKGDTYGRLDVFKKMWEPLELPFGSVSLECDVKAEHHEALYEDAKGDLDLFVKPATSSWNKQNSSSSDDKKYDPNKWRSKKEQIDLVEKALADNWDIIEDSNQHLHLLDVEGDYVAYIKDSDAIDMYSKHLIEEAATYGLLMSGDESEIEMVH